VAIASFSLAKLSLLFFGVQDNLVPLFVFFSTVVSYNYIRLTRIKQIDSWFANWLNSNKTYLILLSIFSFLGCGYLMLQLKLQALFMLIPFAFLTAIYVIPPFISKKINLRNLPVVKIFIIAISWAGITVLFPLIQYDLFNDEILWLFLRRFLFVVVLTLPFDIRDVLYDSKSLMTLPIWLGVKKAKILGLVFLMLFLVIELFSIKTNHLWIDVFITVCLGSLLLKSSTDQHKYFSAFWVEGVPILWLGLYLIFA